MPDWRRVLMAADRNRNCWSRSAPVVYLVHVHLATAPSSTCSGVRARHSSHMGALSRRTGSGQREEGRDKHGASTDLDTTPLTLIAAMARFGVCPAGSHSPFLPSISRS